MIPIQIGSKVLTLEQVGSDQVVVRCPCTRLNTEVRVALTSAQAMELFSERRRTIEEVLPDHPPAIREIFLTGTTPAEWDASIRRRMRTFEEYRALGYAPFDENRLQPKLNSRESIKTRRRLKLF